MNIQTTQDLVQHALLDAYDAETQILSALETMQQKTFSPELQKILKMHQRQTQEQITRLEQVLNDLEFDIEELTCKGIHGIIEEGNDMLALGLPDGLPDIAILGNALKVEHYEMALYEHLLTLLKRDGKDENIELMETTLEEEKQTASDLSNLADMLIDIASNADGSAD